MSKNFASKIKKLRKQQGLSKQQLAQLCGVTRLTIYSVEHGDPPSIKTCYKLIKNLNVKLNESLFIKNIRSQRERKGLSMQKLAKEAKVAISTIYLAEKGKLPSLKTCIKVANTLELPFENYMCDTKK